MAGGLDSGEDDLADNHEINVTPFIDVMLVLLIIFMVAAPLSTVDVAVDLPVSTAKAQPRPERPVFLTIKADRTLALGNDPIAAGRSRRRHRCRHADGPAAAPVPARRQERALRRAHARDEPAAQRGIPEGGAGRARRCTKKPAGWLLCSNSLRR